MEIATARPSEMSTAAPPAECDLAVIGGGIVGLAVARELTRRRPDLKAVVLERATQPATGQTGANSGVIHGGIYYAPGSLKARLCVEGAAEMYEFCERHEIRHERCGKVIVARHEGELARLDELERRGIANGVPGLRRLSGEELREIEPHCRGVAALHSPATGIVDFAEVARALAAPPPARPAPASPSSAPVRPPTGSPSRRAPIPTLASSPSAAPTCTCAPSGRI